MATIESESGGRLSVELGDAKDAADILPPPPLPRQVVPTGLSVAYAEASPRFAEVWTIWDSLEKRSTSPLAAALQRFLAVMIELGPAKEAAYAVRKVLRGKVKTLASNLASDGHRIVRASLRLMTAVVRHSATSARDLLQRFSMNSKAFQAIAALGQGGSDRRGKKKGASNRGRGGADGAGGAGNSRLEKHASTVRAEFVNFVVSLLQCPATDVQRDVLVEKGTVMGLVKGINLDAAPRARLVLSVVLHLVLANGNVPARVRQQAVTPNTLAAIVERVYLHADEEVRAVGHAFLVAACAGTEKWNALAVGGRDAQDSARGSASQKTARLALRFVLQLKANEDVLQADLLVRIVGRFRSLLAMYLSDFPYSLEPRNSPKWLANMALLSRLLQLRVSPASGLVVPAPKITVAPRGKALESTSDGESDSVDGADGAGPTSGLRPSIPSAEDSTKAVLAASLGISAHHAKNIMGESTEKVPHSASDVVTVGALRGFDAVSALRNVVPSSFSKALVTRGVLHMNDLVVYTTLNVLVLLLTRFLWLSREVERETQEAAMRISTSKDAVAQARAAAAERVQSLQTALLAHIPDARTLLSVRARALKQAAGDSAAAGAKAGGDAAGSALTPEGAALIHARLLCLLRLFSVSVPSALSASRVDVMRVVPRTVVADKADDVLVGPLDSEPLSVQAQALMLLQSALRVADPAWLDGGASQRKSKAKSMPDEIPVDLFRVATAAFARAPSRHVRRAARNTLRRMLRLLGVVGVDPLVSRANRMAGTPDANNTSAIEQLDTDRAGCVDDSHEGSLRVSEADAWLDALRHGSGVSQQCLEFFRTAVENAAATDAAESGGAGGPASGGKRQAGKWRPSALLLCALRLVSEDASPALVEYVERVVKQLLYRSSCPTELAQCVIEHRGSIANDPIASAARELYCPEWRSGTVSRSVDDTWVDSAGCDAITKAFALATDVDGGDDYTLHGSTARTAARRLAKALVAASRETLDCATPSVAVFCHLALGGSWAVVSTVMQARPEWNVARAIACAQVTRPRCLIPDSVPLGAAISSGKVSVVDSMRALLTTMPVDALFSQSCAATARAQYVLSIPMTHELVQEAVAARFRSSCLAADVGVDDLVRYFLMVSGHAEVAVATAMRCVGDDAAAVRDMVRSLLGCVTVVLRRLQDLGGSGRHTAACCSHILLSKDSISSAFDLAISGGASRDQSDVVEMVAVSVAAIVAQAKGTTYASGHSYQLYARRAAVALRNAISNRKVQPAQIAVVLATHHVLSTADRHSSIAAMLSALGEAESHTEDLRVLLRSLLAATPTDEGASLPPSIVVQVAQLVCRPDLDAELSADLDALMLRSLRQGESHDTTSNVWLDAGDVGRRLLDTYWSRLLRSPVQSTGAQCLASLVVQSHGLRSMLLDWLDASGFNAQLNEEVATVVKCGDTADEDELAVKAARRDYAKLTSKWSKRLESSESCPLRKFVSLLPTIRNVCVAGDAAALTKALPVVAVAASTLLRCTTSNEDREAAATILEALVVHTEPTSSAGRSLTRFWTEYAGGSAGAGEWDDVAARVVATMLKSRSGSSDSRLEMLIAALRFMTAALRRDAAASPVRIVGAAAGDMLREGRALPRPSKMPESMSRAVSEFVQQAVPAGLCHVNVVQLASRLLQSAVGARDHGVSARDLFAAIVGSPEFVRLFAIGRVAERDAAQSAASLLLYQLIEADVGCLEGERTSDIMRLLLSAYSASMSIKDRCIFGVLQLFEKNGHGLASVGYKWGDAAVDALRVDDDGALAASKVTSKTAALIEEYTWVYDGAPGRGKLAKPVRVAARSDGVAPAAGATDGTATEGADATTEDKSGSGAAEGADEDEAEEAAGDATTAAGHGRVKGRASRLGFGLLYHRVHATMSRFPVYRSLSPESLQQLMRDAGVVMPAGVTAENMLRWEDCDGLGSDGAPASQGITASLYGADTETVYDPSFVLPLLLHILSTSKPHSKKFVISGALSIALGSLSSACRDTRASAYDVVAGYFEMISSEEERFREKAELHHALRVLRDSVPEALARLPTLHALFVAEAADIALRPSHSMYRMVNSSLLKHPVVELRDTPLFKAAFLGAMTATHGERSWVLRLLLRGIQGNADHNALARRHVYTHLMVLADSTAADRAHRTAALDLLSRAATLRVPRLDAVEVAEDDHAEDLGAAPAASLNEDADAVELSAKPRVWVVALHLLRSEGALPWLRNMFCRVCNRIGAAIANAPDADDADAAACVRLLHCIAMGACDAADQAAGVDADADARRVRLAAVDIGGAIHTFCEALGSALTTQTDAVAAIRRRAANQRTASAVANLAVPLLRTAQRVVSWLSKRLPAEEGEAMQPLNGTAVEALHAAALTLAAAEPARQECLSLLALVVPRVGLKPNGAFVTMCLDGFDVAASVEARRDVLAALALWVARIDVADNKSAGTLAFRLMRLVECVPALVEQGAARQAMLTQLGAAVLRCSGEDATVDESNVWRLIGDARTRMCESTIDADGAAGATVRSAVAVKAPRRDDGEGGDAAAEATPEKRRRTAKSPAASGHGDPASSAAKRHGAKKHKKHKAHKKERESGSAGAAASAETPKPRKRHRRER